MSKKSQVYLGWSSLRSCTHLTPKGLDVYCFRQPKSDAGSSTPSCTSHPWAVTRETSAQVGILRNLVHLIILQETTEDPDFGNLQVLTRNDRFEICLCQGVWPEKQEGGLRCIPSFGVVSQLFTGYVPKQVKHQASKQGLGILARGLERGFGIEGFGAWGLGGLGSVSRLTEREVCNQCP